MRNHWPSPILGEQLDLEGKSCQLGRAGSEKRSRDDRLQTPSNDATASPLRFG
jgi:hypothetical protein